MITHNKDYTKFNSKCTYTEFHKKKQLQTKHVHNNNKKEDIYYWIDLYKFTHFFTLRFQTHNETENLERAEQQLRRHIIVFEKKLFGRHWNHKHLFFIACAEKGKGCYWHFHILFKFDGISIEKIINALAAVEKEMQLSSYSICLDVIDHLPKIVTRYSTKEIRFNQNSIGDTSTIIPSTVLFNVPYSKTYHYQFNETNPQIMSKCEDTTEDIITTDKPIKVTEKAAPETKTPILKTVYNKAKSILTSPFNYISKMFDQCLFHCAYAFPVDEYYLYHFHRELYEDLVDPDGEYG